jgi:hypothetical protein
LKADFLSGFLAGAEKLTQKQQYLLFLFSKK